MKQSIFFVVGVICLFLFWSCQNNNANSKSDNNEVTENSMPNQLGHGYDFIGNGKLPLEILDSTYTEMDLDSFPLPHLSKELIDGLNHQLKLLEYRKDFKKNIAGRAISKKELKTTIKALIASQFNNSFGVKQSLHAYQLSGEDERGNVHFTGYFTPVLEVRKKRDAVFQFPIYKFPKKWKGKLPTRREIDEEGLLEDKGLEIAYGKSKLDIYVMHVQGSGIIQYKNGTTLLLAHAGSNKHPYRSIGKYMIEQGLTTKEEVSLKSIQNYFEEHPNELDDILSINPSYIFFSPKKRKPQGAGNVALTPIHSVAVDKNFIPLGSCLLGSVPILDVNRNFSHHEYRILLAQDVGGAIKGSGHVDLYTGIGSSAKNAASNLHHYGRVWILLPKEVNEE